MDGFGYGPGRQEVEKTKANRWYRDRMNAYTYGLFTIETGHCASDHVSARNTLTKESGAWECQNMRRLLEGILELRKAFTAS